MSSYIVWKFLWACSTKVAPLTGKIFAVHFCIGVCFIPVETAAPTLKSDGAQLNFDFLLLCEKLHMKFERTPLLKDVTRRFAIEWNVTSAESCSRRNLKMRSELLWFYETCYAPNSEHIIILFCRAF